MGKLLAILAIGLTIAHAPIAAQDPPVHVSPFKARQITPQVHLLATPEDYVGPAIGNVTVIEQSDGFVVIDSGQNAANGRAVVRSIKARSSKPVKAVAITHWHNDHPQGVSAIRDAWPNLRIIATSATEAGMLGPEANTVGFAPDPRFDVEMKKLVDQARTDLGKLLEDPATPEDRKARIRKALVTYGTFLDDYKGTYIVPPTETFEREPLLDDPQVPVRLLHLGRANTDGDLVAWLPKQEIVVTGDIVVSPTPFGFFSFPGDWIATIDKIKALGFKTLIPGHGEPMADGSYLDKLQVAIAAIRAKVAPLAKQGVPLEEVKKTLDLSKEGEAFGNTTRVRSNFKSLFADPMIANVYKEALAQPIVQGEDNPKPAYSHTPPKPRSLKHPT